LIQIKSFWWWAIMVLFGSNGGMRFHSEPKPLTDGGAKTAAFALQKIHFPNGRF
jgi:hypothetical protein